MKEDRRRQGKKRKKKKKKKKKRKYESSTSSSSSVSSEEQRRDRKRVRIDEEAALKAMTRLVGGRPSLTTDLRTVFVAMDNGQSVVLDSIKNEELKNGLRELFDMMRLGKKGKYKVKSSDRGLMMRLFGDRLKEIETMWEQLKSQNSDEKVEESEKNTTNTTVESMKSTTQITIEPMKSTSTTKKTPLGPSRPPSNWKPAEMSSSDDDEFGPAPESSDNVRTAQPEVLVEMKKREDELKRKELRNRAKAWHKMGYEVEDKTLLQDDPITEQNGRQSWMTQLPSSRNGSNPFGAIFKKGGKSQFRQRAAKESDGSWTQTPQERLEKDMAKKRSDLFGIPLPKHSAAKPKQASLTNAPVKVSSSSTTKRRGKSLLDMHRERIANKATSSSQSGSISEVRWDRDRDMSLKSGSSGSNKSELGKILQSASEMRNRFSSSS